MSFVKMKFFIATILLAACAAVQGGSVPSGLDTRVIDGTPAKKGQLPWQAALIIDKGPGVERGLCGGSLISERIILTAAHCLPGAISIEIHLGGVNLWSDMEYNEISTNFMSHANYNPNTFENDVALVALPVPVTISGNIQIIPLPARSQPDLTGQSLRVSGYGKTLTTVNSEILQFIDMTVMNSTECNRYYPELTFPSNICAHGDHHQSTCSGDSGGPLVQYNTNAVLVGVVSYGKIMNCALGYPVGFARVSSFLDWINQYTGIPIRD